MPKPDYLGPFPDLYVGDQRLWKVFAGDKKVWPEMDSTWVLTLESSIYYSEDGISWTQATLPSGFTSVTSTAPGNRVSGNVSVNPSTGEWCVACPDGKILKSDDAITWTEVATGSTGDLISVGYGDGLWVVGHENYSSANPPRRRFSYSSDRLNWTESSLPRIGTLISNNDISGYYDVLYRKNGTRNWWLNGFAGSYYSSNGTSYTGTSRTYLTDVGYARSAASDGEDIIVIAHETNFTSGLRTSTDGGSTWTGFFQTEGNALYFDPRRVAHGGGYFMTETGLRSPDGINWTSTLNVTDQNNEDVAYDHVNGRWLIVDRKTTTPQGTNVWWSDDDGDTWTLEVGVITGGSAYYPRSVMNGSGTPDTTL